MASELKQLSLPDEALAVVGKAKGKILWLNFEVAPCRLQQCSSVDTHAWLPCLQTSPLGKGGFGGAQIGGSRPGAVCPSATPTV